MVRDRLRSTDLGATAGSLASKSEALHIHGDSVLYFTSLKLLPADIVVDIVVVAVMVGVVVVVEIDVARNPKGEGQKGKKRNKK